MTNITPPLEMLMALDGIYGVKKIQLRGRNSAISNSAETVWGPGSTYARMTSGTALEIVSGSASDAAAGTGARTVKIWGLNGSYVPVSETVTLNGTNAVALANTSLIAVNGAEVVTAGSGATNAGAITIRTVSGSTSKAQIPAGTFIIGRSADFLYTVPANFKAVLMPVRYSATGVTGDLTAWVRSYTSAGVVKDEGFDKTSLYVTGFNGAFGTINLGGGLCFPEKTLIELQAIASAGAGDFVAMADLYLIDTTVLAWSGSLAGTPGS